MLAPRKAVSAATDVAEKAAADTAPMAKNFIDLKFNTSFLPELYRLQIADSHVED